MVKRPIFLPRKNMEVGRKFPDQSMSDGIIGAANRASAFGYFVFSLGVNSFKAAKNYESFRMVIEMAVHDAVMKFL